MNKAQTNSVLSHLFSEEGNLQWLSVSKHNKVFKKNGILLIIYE